MRVGQGLGLDWGLLQQFLAQGVPQQGPPRGGWGALGPPQSPFGLPMQPLQAAGLPAGPPAMAQQASPPGLLGGFQAHAYPQYRPQPRPYAAPPALVTPYDPYAGASSYWGRPELEQALNNAYASKRPDKQDRRSR